MPSLFISYRREDSAGFAGRLADALERDFPAEQVFRDVDDIRPGEDFVRAIEDRLAAVDVMLVLIGPRWLEASRDGRRRLEAADDFVRLEVRTALALGKPVIPLLVGVACMPAEADLPEDIRPLARRQAFVLSDAGWRTDVERLRAALLPLLQPRPTVRRRWHAWASGLAAALGISLGLFALTQRSTPIVPPSAPAPARQAPEDSVGPSADLRTTPSDVAPATKSKVPATPAAPPPARRVPRTVQPLGDDGVDVPAPVPARAAAEHALAGRWRASVRYDWGDVHPEVFEFEVVDGEITGVASYLRLPRPIRAGEVSGERLSFTTQSQEMLGSQDASRTVTHRYRGTLEGDTIRFTLETSGGYSAHSPIQFIAHRKQP